jgi:hypothetical protein
VHLERAWKIRNVDPAMAMFRGLTAEEEAASALIYALRDRRYNDSSRLNPHDHSHKHSIYPFLEIISDWFAESTRPLEANDKRFEWQIDDKGHIATVHGVQAQFGSPADPNRLKIRFKIHIDGKDAFAVPNPPLNWNVIVDGKLISFQHHMKKFASLRHAKHVEKYIREKANERNTLLYATPQCCPDVTFLSDEFFIHQRRKVITIAYAYLLIEPYKEKQAFVQQALDALLKMLGRTEAMHLHDAF